MGVNRISFIRSPNLKSKLWRMQGILVVNKLQRQSSVAQLMAGNNCFLILPSPTKAIIHALPIPAALYR